MRRGEIFTASLDPVVGSEANRTRPVVIVSNNQINTQSAMTPAGVVTVVPITTNTEFVALTHVFLPALESPLTHDSKAQAEQIRTISALRLTASPLGTLTRQQIEALDRALRHHLDLW